MKFSAKTCGLHPCSMTAFMLRTGRNKMYLILWLVDQIRSVAQSCSTLCDPMNRSTPGLPAHHQLPEFTQTHVHGVSDAIQPSHPLSSPSPLAPKPSQHQSPEVYCGCYVALLKSTFGNEGLIPQLQGGLPDPHLLKALSGDCLK